MLVTAINGAIVVAILGVGYMGWAEFCHNMGVEEPFAMVAKYICNKVYEFTAAAWAYGEQLVYGAKETKDLSKEQQERLAAKAAEAFDAELKKIRAEIALGGAC